MSITNLWHTDLNVQNLFNLWNVRLNVSYFWSLFHVYTYTNITYRDWAVFVMVQWTQHNLNIIKPRLMQTYTLCDFCMHWHIQRVSQRNYMGGFRSWRFDYAFWLIFPAYYLLTLHLILPHYCHNLTFEFYYLTKRFSWMEIVSYTVAKCWWK